MKKQAVSFKEMTKKCDDVAQVMKALAHPQRLMLLCHLSGGEKTVGDLERLCEVSQSAMSQFLTRMKFEGLVQSEKRGLFVYYRIADEKVGELIAALYHIYCA